MAYYTTLSAPWSGEFAGDYPQVGIRRGAQNLSPQSFHELRSPQRMKMATPAFRSDRIEPQRRKERKGQKENPQ
jgi:hypothetical protein